LSDAEKALEVRGMEVYAGMIENMDYHFGRLVQFLKNIGEYDNTVIIFCSDNGANPWYSEDYPTNRRSNWFAQFDNGVERLSRPGSAYAYGIGWASASVGPLSGFKMTAAEGGIRSPLLVAGPGVIGGRQINTFSYVWDIMPTILAMAGLEPPVEFRGREVEPLKGRSLAGVLSASQEEIYSPGEFVGGEMDNGMWMRQGDYKAVLVAEPYGCGEWQLYNVAADPGETKDIAKEQPEMLEKLKAAWDQYATDVGVVLGKK
jgi:arylsulfatase A-like enzyme